MEWGQGCFKDMEGYKSVKETEKVDRIRWRGGGTEKYWDKRT